MPMNRERLLEYFLQGAKPPPAWGVGLEYERLGLDRATGRAIPFSGPRGVETVLGQLAERFGWEPERDEGRLIGLKRGGSAVTLEPGGQLEMSGSVHRDLWAVRAEMVRHFKETEVVSDPLQIAWIPVGLHPVSPVEEIEWVPKSRYRILAPFLGSRGPLAHQMMKGTAGVQVNLDYESAGDAAEKFRTAMGITGILTAASAHSPLYEGRRTGLLSRRARIWEETDPARCGLLEFAFREDPSIGHYVEYALDVPMIFVLRQGSWIPMEGLPFRRFMAEGHRGLEAAYDDWVLHLTTIFTEVRLKTYVEVRGADSVPPELAMALAAVWKGILYDAGARRGAWELVEGHSFEARVEFQREVASKGLDARLGSTSARDLCGELARLAREGLERMASSEEGAPSGRNEQDLLNPLEDLVQGGTEVPAAGLLRCWECKEAGLQDMIDCTARDARRFASAAVDSPGI